jgi:hypothetical protein
MIGKACPNRTLIALVALAVAGVAGFFATSPRASADPVPIPAPYTFTADDVGFAEGGAPTGLADRLDEMDTYLGAKKPIIRLDLEWWYVQDCAACALRWDKLDPIVDAAYARGSRVLIILAYGAPWANGGRGDDGRWFPADDAAWRGIVDATVAHFGPKVQAYEVWNEPNNADRGDYGDGSAAARRQRYWDLARIAHDRVHAGCAGCVVLAGGSGNGTAVSPARNDNESATWLDWAYQHGYGDTFDAVAHHPYPAWNSGLSPSHPECVTRWWNMFGPPDEKCGELAAVRAVMVRHGDGAKKIWGTEFGYPSSGAGITTVPIETVRDDLEEGVRMWHALDYTGPLFVYSYRDSLTCAPGSTDPECHFGLTDATGHPKQPIYDDLALALTDTPLPSLAPGRSLHRRSALRSADARYYLWLQGDGNLVLYRVLGTGTTVLWTRGNQQGARLTNQHDGNLVLYDNAGKAVWSSATSGRGDSRLILRDDGNLALYPNATPNRPSWSTGTAQP